jgi:uncharacterized membrane protein YoaK (UPF0700 family)
MKNVRTQVTWLAATAITAAVILATLPALAQQATFRNSSGRTTGTAATTGNMTTFRDSSGRTVGTGAVDSSGTTTFRDGSGRTTGTSTATHKVRTGPF